MPINQLNTSAPNFSNTGRIAPSASDGAAATNMMNVSAAPILAAGRGAVDAVQQHEEVRKRDAATAKAQRDAVLEKMLRDPKNAEYYSKQYGIPLTPELQGLLAEPKKAALLADAYKMANESGIKNYEAKRAFAQKYIETGGNMVEATAAIQGMDTREQMTPYQERTLEVKEHGIDARRGGGGHGTGGAGARPRNVPLNFNKVAGSLLNDMRGVEFTDPKHPENGITDTSAAPMDNQTMQMVLAKASQYYQESGDPNDAVMRALQDIGGEEALEDSDKVAQDNWDSLPFGLGSPDVHYKRLKGPSAGGATAAPGAAPSPAGDPTVANVFDPNGVYANEPSLQGPGGANTSQGAVSTAQQPSGPAMPQPATPKMKSPGFAQWKAGAPVEYENPSDYTSLFQTRE